MGVAVGSPRSQLSDGGVSRSTTIQPSSPSSTKVAWGSSTNSTGASDSEGSDGGDRTCVEVAMEDGDVSSDEGLDVGIWKAAALRAEGEVYELECKVKEMDKKACQMRGDIERLHAKVSKGTQARNKLRAFVAELEEQVEGLEGRAGTLQEEVHKLQDALDDARNWNSKLEDILAEETSECHRAQAEAGKLATLVGLLGGDVACDEGGANGDVITSVDEGVVA
ncbi:hypothetical protein JAAARDRAFT_51558 [Jaapia argillacea MUCL 33604]|uniref:Uncharacterized protein n=1 Tax=Jaapia argillacea MUCL 33604 TaxID=933084 RepID=A0A067P4P3_9AGAM|nr:hypothetical protein JAAARDRAFT_51558 [Jaapia argillacea MUCL 33604]